ncbi:hypothetical protein CPB84DRAFT_1791313, partial [Gymnopilus junonius]
LAAWCISYLHSLQRRHPQLTLPSTSLRPPAFSLSPSPYSQYDYRAPFLLPEHLVGMVSSLGATWPDFAFKLLLSCQPMVGVKMKALTC